mgnify:CR=1 FL=1
MKYKENMNELLSLYMVRLCSWVHIAAFAASSMCYYPVVNLLHSLLLKACALILLPFFVPKNFCCVEDSAAASSCALSSVSRRVAHNIIIICQYFLWSVPLVAIAYTCNSVTNFRTTQCSPTICITHG